MSAIVSAPQKNFLTIVVLHIDFCCCHVSFCTSMTRQHMSLALTTLEIAFNLKTLNCKLAKNLGQLFFSVKNNCKRSSLNVKRKQSISMSAHFEIDFPNQFFEQI